MSAFWTDPSLTWDPVDYGYLYYLDLSPGDVWIPVVGVINAKYDHANPLVKDNSILLSSGGRFQIGVNFVKLKGFLQR